MFFGLQREILNRLGKVEKTFCFLLVGYLALVLMRPASWLVPLTQFVLIVLAAWIGLRLTRQGMRKAIWRLRNRLLVTYLFIAVVPVALVLILAGVGAYAMTSQLAVYLAVSELERRGDALRNIAETLAQPDGRVRPEVMSTIAQIYRNRFQDLRMLVQNGATVQAWPADGGLTPPPARWQNANGVIVQEGRLYLWSHAVHGSVKATALAPLSRAYLSSLVPNLGDVTLLDIADRDSGLTVKSADGSVTHVRTSKEPPAPIPPAYNRFDRDVPWISTVPVWHWDQPGKKDLTLLRVRTRPSAVLQTIVNTKVDQIGQLVPILLLVLAVLFLIVEAVALVIGVSLTRTITRAVHNLYRGTQRVIEGDFATRIQVHGKDQLADLSSSFNTMTENLESLLVVAKEKERLQAEVEIARQVQEQLYPKVTPALRTLQLKAICEPARMVSGDYYDYLCLPDGRLALAIGDVAGKGISAALLMATIQSAMRMELRTGRAAAAPGGSMEGPNLSTSRLVSDLNQQLHATTAPEKYATFFFAFYNDVTGELAYTNAGHLAPLVMRDGRAIRLQTSGTVVGAFPFARYEDNYIQLNSGDLLVCYTDGITEPENEYGEEFGEERLIDLITRNLDCDDNQIATLVLEAVHEWTSAAEQPDDMTLLLARRS